MRMASSHAWLASIGTQLAAVQERWTLKLVLLVNPYRQVARRQVEDK